MADTSARMLALLALLQSRPRWAGPELAARLDIVPAFASRLAKELERRELIRRLPSETDRRVIFVEATDGGHALLDDVDRHVRREVDYFQSTLGDDERQAALSIFSFYVGSDS